MLQFSIHFYLKNPLQHNRSENILIFPERCATRPESLCFRQSKDHVLSQGPPGSVTHEEAVDLTLADSFPSGSLPLSIGSGWHAWVSSFTLVDRGAARAAYAKKTPDSRGSVQKETDCGHRLNWGIKDTVSAGKQGPSCKELGHYAAHRPDVHCNIKKRENI